MCVQGIVEIFLSSVLMINTAGDLGQWKSEVSECSPWCCHPRGDHPLNGRVQDREGSSHLSRLHPRERPPAPGVRLLVPERADDQLRHGSRGHRHHHAGKEDELPAEHTKVRNWQKYSRKSVFFLCSAQPHHSGNYTCKPSSSIPASIQLFVLGQRPTKKIKKQLFIFRRHHGCAAHGQWWPVEFDVWQLPDPPTDHPPHPPVLSCPTIVRNIIRRF